MSDENHFLHTHLMYFTIIGKFNPFCIIAYKMNGNMVIDNPIIGNYMRKS